MRKGSLFILLLAIAMGGIAAFMARNWIAAHAIVSSAEQSGTIVPRRARTDAAERADS